MIPIVMVVIAIPGLLNQCFQHTCVMGLLHKRLNPPSQPNRRTTRTYKRVWALSPEKTSLIGRDTLTLISRFISTRTIDLSTIKQSQHDDEPIFVNEVRRTRLLHGAWLRMLLPDDTATPTALGAGTCCRLPCMHVAIKSSLVTLCGTAHII
jgi:hypothetical protein